MGSYLKAINHGIHSDFGDRQARQALPLDTPF